MVDNTINVVMLAVIVLSILWGLMVWRSPRAKRRYAAKLLASAAAQEVRDNYYTNALNDYNRQFSATPHHDDFELIEEEAVCS